MTVCTLADKNVSMHFERNYALNDSNIGLTAEDLSEEMKKAVWPVTILIGFEAVLGITGNTLIMIVYTSRYRRCNFKYFVICMAVIDIISCLTTLPGEIISQMNWYSYKYDLICKIKSYFNVYTVWSSALVLLLLAYDRYRKICRPLEWQIRPSWAIRSCLISVGISSVISAPVAILWGKQNYEYKDGHQNITVSICEKSGIYADRMYPFLFIVSAYMFPIGIMICIIYILNFKIARAIFVNNPGKEKATGPILNIKDKINAERTEGEITRYGNEQEEPCSCKINRRRSSAKLPCHNGKDCTPIQSNGNVYSLVTVAEVNHNLKSQNDSTTVDPSCCKPSVTCKIQNGYEEQKTNFRFKRSRSSTCSSDSSESIVLNGITKQPKPVFRSYKWHNRLTRNRTAENNSYAVEDETVDAGHNCARKEVRALRLKRKTEIMLILTTVFTITIIIYLILVSLVASQQSILRNLKKSEKVIFFFFWRLYFINCVINPVLYGLLDPRFRRGLKEIFCTRLDRRKKSSNLTTTHITVV